MLQKIMLSYPICCRLH